MRETLTPINQPLPGRKALMTLSIIIVNWNTRELLLQCLASIYAAQLTDPHLSFEVIVVDNASSDGSVQAVRKQFPQVHVIENAQNVGFARANNQAIAQSSGQFVLLLNSDTEVFPNALYRLTEFLDAHPGVGGAGPKILNPDRSLQASCFRFPTVAREFWRLLHLEQIWPVVDYRMERWEQVRPRSVDVLLGACLLLRRDALDEAGVLDEIFFMYSEEVDLCYRLHQKGWELSWIPEAEIVHYGGQSTAKIAPEMFLELYRSKVRYFHKHYGMRAVILYKAVLFLAAIPRALLPLPQRLLPSAGKRLKKTGENYRRLIIALPNL